MLFQRKKHGISDFYLNSFDSVVDKIKQTLNIPQNIKIFGQKKKLFSSVVKGRENLCPCSV